MRTDAESEILEQSALGSVMKAARRDMVAELEVKSLLLHRKGAIRLRSSSSSSIASLLL